MSASKTNKQSLDLTKLYEVRTNFIVIGLTGRTGSGTEKISEILTNDFDNNSFPIPITKNDQKYPEQIKYEIAYNFLKSNYVKFVEIKYRNLILYYLFKKDYDTIISCINNTKYFKSSDFDKIKSELKQFEKSHKEIKNELDLIKNDRTADDLRKLHSVFFGEKFKLLCDEFQQSLKQINQIATIKLIQLFANNLRSIGDVDTNNSDINFDNIYHIANFINLLIKSCRQMADLKPCCVVINSLKNSLEMNYFKQRYSAFYMVSVSRPDDIRKQKIKKNYKNKFDKVLEIDENEYKGEQREFYKQDVSNCIQKSDIHLFNVDENDLQKLKIYESGLFLIPSIKHQIVNYLALILHPGIITPSPIERCMQMAYTAKYNSGCISRQVGAVITDEFYSIKAIGWNNTPEGHIPCLLKSVRYALNNESNDIFYSNYERNRKSFLDTIKKDYNSIESNLNLKGRNVSYCFKSIINSYQEGKNQVHTRSLHAEENAFLQIAKYGGQGIKGGFLFSTASPCELCAKKAYQLGVKRIFYIDPYPGITEEHIIKCGTKENRPIMINFFGAIGNAYHWLYEPFMAYKDELNLILGIEQENVYEKTIKKEKELNDKIKKMEKENKRLNKKLLKQ